MQVDSLVNHQFSIDLLIVGDATSMVRTCSGDHVHFVDGSGGGYTLAAKRLKDQLSTLAN